jgi:tetratricopeptide (TPR) repeat protein
MAVVAGERSTRQVTSRPRRRPRALLVAYALPCLAAVALYAPTLRYERTYDDRHQVLEPDDPKARTLVELWTEAYWPDAGYGYRPVLSSTFWAEARGGVPLPLRHALNVLLHAGVTALVVRLILSLGPPAWAAALAGLLFAVHPTHVEAVAGLVGRAEMLVAGAMLLALWLHDRAALAARPIAVLPAALLAFVAASVKETAWGLPAYAGVLLLVRQRRMLASLPMWVGYALGIAAHFVLRRAALGAWINAPDAMSLVRDNPLYVLDGVPRLVGGLRSAGLHLAQLAFPVRMAPDYAGLRIDGPASVDDLRLWGGVAIVAGSGLLALAGVRMRNQGAGRPLSVGGGWLLLSALATMNLLVTMGTMLADRLLYWPTVAGALLVAGGATLAGARGRIPRVAVSVLLGLLAVAYTVRAALYLPAWHDDLTLFTESVRVVPGSPRAWYNLGVAHQEHGDHDEALALYHRAREMDPTRQDVWAQEAALLLELGRIDEARTAIERAIVLDPSDVGSRINHALVQLAAGDADQAASELQAIVKADPERLDALLNLAFAERTRGRLAESEAALRGYVAARPTDPKGLGTLAWLLGGELGRADEAEPFARRAVAAAPDDADLYDTLAVVLERQGRRAEATLAAREAVRLDPDPAYRERLERLEGARSP